MNANEAPFIKPKWYIVNVQMVLYMVCSLT